MSALWRVLTWGGGLWELHWNVLAAPAGGLPNYTRERLEILIGTFAVMFNVYGAVYMHIDLLLRN